MQMQSLKVPGQQHYHQRSSSEVSNPAQISQLQQKSSISNLVQPIKTQQKGIDSLMYQVLIVQFIRYMIDNVLDIKRYKKKQKELTIQQIQVFRQAFEIFDCNHSGSIDESQLKSLMNALGYDYSQQKIKKILQEIDQDGSGVIEINQFVDFMSKHMLDTENLKKQMKKVFAHFDDDNAGYLDFRKLKIMTTQCFFNLDDDAIRNMINAADTQGDGKISEYQFFRIMKKVKLI